MKIYEVIALASNVSKLTLTRVIFHLACDLDNPYQDMYWQPFLTDSDCEPTIWGKLPYTSADIGHSISDCASIVAKHLFKDLAIILNVNYLREEPNDTFN